MLLSLTWFVNDAAFNSGQTHAHKGIYIVTDQIYFHIEYAFPDVVSTSLQLTKNHEGNDQTIQADTLCQTYEDQGLTKNRRIFTDCT